MFVRLRTLIVERLDIHTQEVVRSASVALVLRVAGAGLGFLFTVLLARQLGAEGTGIYYLAFTIATIASVASNVGLDNALLRFTAASASREDWPKVAGAYNKSVRLAASISVSVAVLVFTGSPWIAREIFSNVALVQPLQIMALGILPMSLFALHAESLKGLKRVRDAALVQGGGVWLFALPLVAVLGGPFGTVGAAAAYTLAAYLMLALSIGLWRQATPQLKGIRGIFDTRLLLQTSLPLLWVNSMILVMGWADTIMLGIWNDSESVGIYSVAARTAMLTTFVLFAVNSAVAPRFAALYAHGSNQALGNLARNSAKLMIVLILPIVLLFALAPAWVLGFFGSAFEKGAVVLVILTAGQFVNVATGSVGYLLMMSGYEKAMRNNILASTALNITLNALLIPPYGIVVAASATAISVVAMNLISTVLVYRKLSIIALPIPKGFFDGDK